MPTPVELVEGSLEAANAARATALEKTKVPAWLPSVLCFDWDSDGIPDLLEPHLWSDALNIFIWASLTLASPNTVLFKAASKISQFRDNLPSRG